MDNVDAGLAPLWLPTETVIEHANLTRFMRWLRERADLDFADYNALWAWSTENLADFWGAVWSYFALDEVTSYTTVLTPDPMPDARWFVGARVNYAQRVLAVGDPEWPAIIGVTEDDGCCQVLTRAELRSQVAALAATLRGLGVQPGDCVVGYLPHIAQAYVAFLAAAAVGAVWSIAGQEYAPSAVLDRFAQLAPKVLVTADGNRFAGKHHDRRAAVEAVISGLPSLVSTIVVDRFESAPAGPHVISWDSALAATSDPWFADVGFDDPLWVVFSSGTTGLPKGLVHSHGGVLVEHLKLLSLHWDMKPADRFFWYTSPSWMMWNLSVSALLPGSSIVCYDGSSTHPDTRRLWELVARHGVTIFGTSPAYLQASEKAGVSPSRDFDLSKLRMVGSTGSPLPAATHRWAANAVGNVPVISASGGTDVVSGFCGGVPTVPVWPGEMSVRMLGVAMDSWDEHGRPVRDQVGELVLTKPMPSMPIKLWGDTGGRRYREAYFSTFADVWRHGDWITLTRRGSVVIHGRSDSLLNRNGVRMGSADVYAIVEGLDEVIESLMLGVEEPDGAYWMPLFVRLRDGVELDDELTARIARAIRRDASPRHVPDQIIAMAGIPHTLTGKKLEVPIKRLFQGADLANLVSLEAVDDPALLHSYARLARVRAAAGGGLIALTPDASAAPVGGESP